MCVKWAGEWRKTTRSIIAYKVVKRDSGKRGIFRSPYLYRIPQTNNSLHLGFNTNDPSRVGKVLLYVVGETVSSNRPGIYLYRSKEEAMELASEMSESRIIKVRIPTGTWIRYANKNKINATQVIVLGVVK